jgi:hypothetical protein
MPTTIKTALTLLLAGCLWGCSEQSSPSDAGLDADAFVDPRPAPVCNPGTFGYSGPVFADVSQRVGLVLGVLGPEDTEAACSDGYDNDEDGATDCADTSCRYQPGLLACPGEENSDALCADGQDNDADGFTDCNDYSCSQNSFVSVCQAVLMERTTIRCTDGVDNDGDGFTDCADHDCYDNASLDVCGRENSEALCGDGQDNDSDGLVDCADPDCVNKSAIEGCGREDTDALCGDGQDNDSDGLVDCADPNCSRNVAVAVCPPVVSDPTGFRLTGADLDGDGYVDLVAISSGGNARGLQRVYFNRPDPADPARRVFVESWDTNIGATRRSGLRGRSANFHVAGDVDNDGDVDLYAGTYVSQLEDLMDRQEILLNDGSGHFSLLEGGSSLATTDPPAETTAVLFDYDSDGVLDLIIGNWYERYGISLDSLQDELWKGHGDGSFTRVTDAAGLAQLAGTGSHEHAKPTYGLSVCDIDGDGDGDILEAAYGRQWNDLWINQGDGTFANIGASSGYAGDDLVDYSDNQFYLCYCRGRPDDCPPDMPAPSVDCSARGWSADDEAPYRLNGNTFGAQCGDFDGDGDLDVFLVEITHSWAGTSSDRSMLLVNNGQTGTDLTFTRLTPAESGILREWQGVFWNEGDLYAGWIDYDNDGRLDLLVNAGAYPDDRLYFFRQRDDGKFAEAARAVGLELANPHALVLSDYDLDGDVDVIASVVASSSTPWRRSHLFLFENQLGQLNNWTRIELQGKGPPAGANRQAIGARVTVTSRDLVQVREVRSAAGQGGQQDEPALTFGLRHHCEDLTIQVRWPNAAHTIQTFAGVRANYRLRLIEGQDQPVYLDAR